MPTFGEEQRLQEQGYKLIAGIDEVGRGPLAGPLVAAAVVLPLDGRPDWLRLVRDSKQLGPLKREFLYECIQGDAVGTGVGLVSPEALDVQGVVAATRLAMRLAVEQLPFSPDFLLIDAVTLPDLDIPQKSLIRGDSLSLSIAAASIIAKVSRDRLMVELDGLFPGYGLARNKGYATVEHLHSLRCLGACSIHRKSFAPVREAPKVVSGRRELGEWGERVARDHLEGLGYQILETNLRSGEGEIDIVARQGEYLVFIEVRARASSQFGSPKESVVPKKKRKLIELAQAYLQTRDLEASPWRIDFVAVEFEPSGKVRRVELIENAIN